MGLFNLILLIVFAGGFLCALSGLLLMSQGIFIIVAWCLAKLFPRRLL